MWTIDRIIRTYIPLVVLGITCLLTQGCRTYDEFLIPLSLGKSGTLYKHEFFISKEGTYNISLIFLCNDIKDKKHASRCHEAVDGRNYKGEGSVETELNLKIFKGQEIFLDKSFKKKGSAGTLSSVGANLKSVKLRPLTTLELTTGKFHIETRVLKESKEFDGVNSYLLIHYFAPKI